VSLLTKWFQHKPPAVVAVQCPHTALVPRWANAEDMGKHERISGYQCQACGVTFSAKEAEAYLG
jgi:hypothetical protein